MGHAARLAGTLHSTQGGRHTNHRNRGYVVEAPHGLIVLRLIPIAVLVFVLGYCNPPAQAPSPSKPAAQSGLNAGSSAPVNVPTLPSLFMDSSKWFQEYVAAGGQPNPAWTAHPVTTQDCPAGALCEMLPDHASGRYASYLLFPISATYSTTTADPTPHYFDASGYKSLTVKLRVIAGPNVQFKYDSEADNTCPTPAHIRPFLAHQQGTLESSCHLTSNIG